VSLCEVLEPGSSSQSEIADPVQVVVFNDGDRSVGMVVDQIVDVVEEVAKVRKKSDRTGLLGSAVIGKQVTDFLDLNAVIRASAGNWENSLDAIAAGKTILVADPSAFSRGMIRGGLEMAGYRVLEAASLDEAVRNLEQHPVDVVVAALDLSPKGGSTLLAALRRRPEWKSIPALGLTDSVDQSRLSAARKAGFRDCFARLDHEIVVEAVAQLVAPPDSFEAELAQIGQEISNGD
jgi:two-component system chemotaxis sensor kinase CheA